MKSVDTTLLMFCRTTKMTFHKRHALTFTSKTPTCTFTCILRASSALRSFAFNLSHSSVLASSCRCSSDEESLSGPSLSEQESVSSFTHWSSVHKSSLVLFDSRLIFCCLLCFCIMWLLPSVREAVWMSKDWNRERDALQSYNTLKAKI